MRQNGKSNNASVSALLSARDAIFVAIRHELRNMGSIEVSTPILCPYPDIAPVYQFSTTHPDFQHIASLRIAPTEYLKRLLVEGAENVFEFSTNFRTDPTDVTHLPEFTSLEVMMRHKTCNDMIELTKNLCYAGIVAVGVESKLDNFQPPGTEHVYSLEFPWEIVSIRHFLSVEYGFSADDFFKPNKVFKLYRQVVGGVYPLSYIAALDEIITVIAASFERPVFVKEYPNYLGGPAEPCREDARFKERAELFIGTLELANMSSNLTDAIALRKWHNDGAKVKEKQGIKPNEIDHGLLDAISQGLPTSAVLGLGIDRLIMVSLKLNDIALTRPFSYNKIFNGSNKQ